MFHYSLLEKYQLINKLGSGGTSTVFLAKHRLLHSLRVIKCRSKSKIVNQYSLEESIILSQLHHSRIPVMYDWEEDDQNTYLIMEYCDGQSLKSLIRAQESISEERILQFSLQICEVIQYLHNQEKPILYLDLKPDNLLVSEHGITLIDYGSARFRDEERSREAIAGTIGYAAPEQYNGGILDERTDIYGIGMVMYFMVTGCLFMDNCSHIENVDLKGRCSSQIKRIINRCTKENPKLRYQSVDQIISALTKMQERRTKNNMCKTKTSLTIAVAGVQGKVGVTHVALAFTKYLNQFLGKSLYIERNCSRDSMDIINSKGDFILENEVYISKDLHILPCVKGVAEGLIKEYETVVIDYGVLNKENHQDFERADLCLLVTNSKPWQISNSIRDMIHTFDKSITLILNLTSYKEYEYVIINESFNQVYRVPYIPDLLFNSYDKSIWELIHTMIAELTTSYSKGEKDGRWKKFTSWAIKKTR
ncbi:serine/threonine protein kinase [Anaerosporobacter sp.]